MYESKFIELSQEFSKELFELAKAGKIAKVNLVVTKVGRR